jgi:hypothetical protein
VSDTTTPQPQYTKGLANFKLAHNEQTKLKATFYNNVSVATLVGGFLLPAYNFLQTLQVGRAFTLILGGCLASFVSHAYALWLLRQLRE